VVSNPVWVMDMCLRFYVSLSYVGNCEPAILLFIISLQVPLTTIQSREFKLFKSI